MGLKVKDLLEKALVSINEDRKNAKELLKDVGKYIGENKERYNSVGMVAAKYLEVMQKSNEQRVKVITIMLKEQDAEFGNVSEEEATSIYEDFEEEEKGLREEDK